MIRVPETCDGGPFAVHPEVEELVDPGVDLGGRADGGTVRADRRLFELGPDRGEGLIAGSLRQTEGDIVPLQSHVTRQIQRIGREDRRLAGGDGDVPRESRQPRDGGSGVLPFVEDQHAGGRRSLLFRGNFGRGILSGLMVEDAEGGIHHPGDHRGDLAAAHGGVRVEESPFVAHHHAPPGQTVDGGRVPCGGIHVRDIPEFEGVDLVGGDAGSPDRPGEEDRHHGPGRGSVVVLVGLRHDVPLDRVGDVGIVPVFRALGGEGGFPDGALRQELIADGGELDRLGDGEGPVGVEGILALAVYDPELVGQRDVALEPRVLRHVGELTAVRPHPRVIGGYRGRHHKDEREQERKKYDAE